MNLPASRPRLRFFVLGPIEVRDAAGALPLRRDRHCELLAALLAHRPAAAPASELIDALWGADAPPSAGTTLRAYVSLLRNVLGDETVTTEGGGYRLDAPHGSVDLDVAEQLGAAAHDAATRGDLEAARHLAADALRQWRGPVLGHLGRRDDRGALGSLLRRANAQRAALIELELRARVELGEGPTVLAELLTAATEHPLRESLRCLLITALYRSGRHVDAVREAAAVRAELAEVGLEPSPELVALERAVLTHDRALLVPAPTTRAVLSAPPGSAPSVTSASRDRRRGDRPAPTEPHTAPLVGREPARDVLREWLAGGPSVAVVTGRAGDGKSRLLRDLDVPTGIRVLRTGTPATEAEQPSATVAALVRQLLPLTAAPAWVRNALHEVVPELGGEHHPSAATVMDAASSLLAAAASVAPIVWIADDLHWASPATAALIGHVATGAVAGARVLLATRPDAPSHVAELVALAIRTGGPHLALVPLGEPDVRALVQRWVGASEHDPPPPGVAAAIHVATGGHPLFVTMLVHDLVSAGRIGHDDAGWHGTVIDDPATISGHHHRRLGAYLDAVLRSLGPEARRGLEVLAIAGRPLGSPAWFDAWGAADPSDALRAIEASGLVRVDDDGGYALVHDLVATTVAAAMTPGAALLAHRRVGRAKASREPHVAPSELLSHALHGADDPAIVRWSLAVGAAGMASEPVHVVTRHLDDAQGALDRLEQPADSSVLELASLRLRLARRRLDVVAIDRRAEELLRLARFAGDVETELEAISALADNALESGRHEAGVRLSHEALRLADASRSPRADEITVSLWFSLASVRTEPFGEQLAAVRQLHRWRPKGSAELATGLALIGRLALWDGRLDESVDAFSRAAWHYRQTGHVRGEALSLGNVARTWLLADPAIDVGPLFERARQLLAGIAQPNLIDDDIHAWRLRRAAATGTPPDPEARRALQRSYDDAVAPGLGIWALEIALELAEAMASDRAPAASFLDDVLADVAVGFPHGSPSWASVEVLAAQRAILRGDARAALERSERVAAAATSAAVPAATVLRTHALAAEAADVVSLAAVARTHRQARTDLRARLAATLAGRRPDAVLELLDDGRDTATPGR